MTDVNLAELAKALAAAQGEFGQIKKDKTAKVRMKTGGEYSYSYADLASVRDAVTPALSKHGLAVVHTFRPNGGQVQYLETSLIHTSGASITSSYPIPAIGAHQEIGSAITYARRYSLCAILGVVAEDDDDGAAAPKNPAKPEIKQTAPSEQAKDKLASMASGDYSLVDPSTGEIYDTFKRGADFLVKLEADLNQHPEPDSFWKANEPAFYRAQEAATKAKNKPGMDHCSRIAKLAHKLTQPAEMKP